MTEQRIANVGNDGTARGISSFNQSNSWKKKDNSKDKTNPGHGKGKNKYVRKAGKKGSKYPPPAKKFDSKKPGQHLTKEAWMALTDDQKMQCRNIAALDVDCFAETLLERSEPECPVLG